MKHKTKKWKAHRWENLTGTGRCYCERCGIVDLRNPASQRVVNAPCSADMPEESSQ